MWAPALLMCFCTVVSLWAAIASKIRRDFFLKKPPRLVLKHLSVQVCITSVFIQPFLLQTTTTPAGKVSVGMVTLLKITMGLSFPPAAVQAKTTVKLVRSWPVVSIATVFTPFSATDRLAGISNDIGTSSIFIMSSYDNFNWVYSIKNKGVENSQFILPIVWELLANSCSRSDCQVIPFHELVYPVHTTSTEVHDIHFCSNDASLEFYRYS